MMYEEMKFEQMDDIDNHAMSICRLPETACKLYKLHAVTCKNKAFTNGERPRWSHICKSIALNVRDAMTKIAIHGSVRSLKCKKN